jgi:hypothetical protein
MAWIRNLFWKQEMELTMVGLQNAGKSTLVSVFATGAFSEDMIPTVGFNMRKVTKGNVSIKLWDLGGQPRFRSMWERCAGGVMLLLRLFMLQPHPVSAIPRVLTLRRHYTTATRFEVTSRQVLPRCQCHRVRCGQRRRRCHGRCPP